MQNQTQNPPNPETKRNSSVSSFSKSIHRCLNLFLKNFLTIHPIKTFNKIFILIFIISCITIFACRERVTPPDVDNKPKPGKRDYTWTIDTLAYPGSFQTLMRDIWASSPTNVYVVGHNDQNKGMMYKYDGQKWTPVKLTWSEGGPIRSAIRLSAIYGFGPNDIYAVGRRIYENPTPPPNFLDSSLIIRFDGVRWLEHKVSGGRMLQSIWGSSPTDIWAGGMNTLLHYDGVKWSKYPIEIPPQGIQFISISGLRSTEVYMTGGIIGPGSLIVLLYFYNGTNWSVIDSIKYIAGSPPPITG